MDNQQHNQPENTADNNLPTGANNKNDGLDPNTQPDSQANSPSDEEIARFFQQKFNEQAAQAPKPEFVYSRQSVNRQPVKRTKIVYRNWLLLLAGLLSLTVLVVVLTFSWSIFAYFLQLDVDTAIWTPLLIFMGSLALATALITALSKGGTIYPVLCLWLISSLANFLLVGTADIQLAGAIGRLVIAFLVTISAFTLVKMYYLSKVQREHKDERKAA